MILILILPLNSYMALFFNLCIPWFLYLLNGKKIHINEDLMRFQWANAYNVLCTVPGIYTKCLLSVVSCHCYHCHHYHEEWNSQKPVCITEMRWKRKDSVSPLHCSSPVAVCFWGPAAFLSLGSLGHSIILTEPAFLKLVLLSSCYLQRKQPQCLLSILFLTKKFCTEHPRPFQVFYLFYFLTNNVIGQTIFDSLVNFKFSWPFFPEIHIVLENKDYILGVEVGEDIKELKGEVVPYYES